LNSIGLHYALYISHKQRGEERGGERDTVSSSSSRTRTRPRRKEKGGRLSASTNLEVESMSVTHTRSNAHTDNKKKENKRNPPPTRSSLKEAFILFKLCLRPRYICRLFLFPRTFLRAGNDAAAAARERPPFCCFTQKLINQLRAQEKNKATTGLHSLSSLSLYIVYCAVHVLLLLLLLCGYYQKRRWTREST